ncbi:MAG: LPS biosynthesis protein [Omnitrophica bacterium RIFCSPHIGHO2_02_FULL_51_18]|nr:MAG: LPS biosynthesis protein [Omnitrophica bacterium RIFCSPHIGHO2_02_FULL_51_18]
MRRCRRCLYPENHPLGITFDDEGICSGCRVHEEKDRLDWNDREKKLVRILESYRTKTGRAHDCIIPVSGARDSYFIVHTIKNRFKLNPLLVTYNKHYNTRVGIRNLAYLRTLFGCDCLTLTVSPQIVKQITRATLENIGSMYWHCLAGQTVFPVQIAVRFKIPLIIWGVHQGCDQVGMFSHMDEVEMTRKYRKDHDLMGFEAEDLLRLHPNLKEADLNPYFYPHDKILERVGVRGIYLSNYIRWDSKKQHEDMIRLYGYEASPQERTFDTYNDVDCFHYSSLHDSLKWLKWGYGKVVDHACREIRLKRLTREEAIGLVQAFARNPFNEANLRIFLEWIGMDRAAFFSFVNKFRHSAAPDQSFDGVGNVDSARLEKKENCHFVLTSLREQVVEQGYTLLARGHVDESKESLQLAGKARS